MSSRKVLSNPHEFKRAQREILDMLRTYGFKDAKIIEGEPVKKFEDNELLIIK